MASKTIEEIMAEDQAAMDNMKYENYKVSDLRKVFDAICNPNDWKAPIAVVVKGEMVMPVVAAIKFYTATTPTVNLNVNTMNYLIESEGYRNGPAGDH